MKSEKSIIAQHDNYPQSFLYHSGLKALKEESLSSTPIEVRRAGAKRLVGNALTALAVTAGSVGLGVVALHGIEKQGQFQEQQQEQQVPMDDRIAVDQGAQAENNR
jgi:hypothetical protein